MIPTEGLDIKLMPDMETEKYVVLWERHNLKWNTIKVDLYAFNNFTGRFSSENSKSHWHRTTLCINFNNFRGYNQY